MLETSVFPKHICSAVYSVGYLYLRFSEGDIFVYYNVPESVFDSLVNAGSLNSYFYTYIRDKYNETKIS